MAPKRMPGWARFSTAYFLGSGATTIVTVSMAAAAS
jgi:hypothetical protein